MDPESVVLEEGEILEESEILEDDTAQVCPICFLPLCSGDLTLECKHTFHSECIVRWFRSKNDTCPLCRAEPEVTLKLPDVFHRAKVLIDRQKNGNLNDEYIAMQIQQLQECDHRLRELQDEKKFRQKHLVETVRPRKQELLREYKKLRKEFKQKSIPILKKLDAIDEETHRERNKMQTKIASELKKRRNCLRNVGLHKLNS